MSQVSGWLSRHRNQVVPLDSERSVLLGVPVSGARSVLIAALLDNGIGGVLRVLAKLGGAPVKLVFDVRSRGGLAPEQVRAVGVVALDSISRQIAEESSASKVA